MVYGIMPTSAKSSKRQPRRMSAAEPGITTLADEHLDIVEPGGMNR